MCVRQLRHATSSSCGLWVLVPEESAGGRAASSETLVVLRDRERLKDSDLVELPLVTFGTEPQFVFSGVVLLPLILIFQRSVPLPVCVHFFFFSPYRFVVISSLQMCVCPNHGLIACTSCA